jgi:hypothetical protein
MKGEAPLYLFIGCKWWIRYQTEVTKAGMKATRGIAGIAGIGKAKPHRGDAEARRKAEIGSKTFNHKVHEGTRREPLNPTPIELCSLKSTPICDDLG